ncbi:hypothetical protein ACWEO4_04095 [Streptomyces sp. NPDC004393]|uniref:hypothetical protein n=1 Tax=Streptomyces sp. NPDC004533 TaxID=3154278 RepID=UPI00339E5C7E
MGIRRILAAVFATAALAGLGLTGAATATATTAQGAPTYVTPSQVTPDACVEGGGKVEGFGCVGGADDGRLIID